MTTRVCKVHGGECLSCGYNKCHRALDFHHLDPKEKSFNVGQKGNISYSRMLEESRKCILVCCRCHIEIEDGLIELDGVEALISDA